jgi:hypothetical protein
MTIRLTIKALTMVGALGALAACQPAVPDSGAGAPGRGVGFDRSAAAVAKLDAPLTVQSQTLPSSATANTVNTAAQTQAASTVAPLPAGQPTPAQIALATPAPQTLPAASVPASTTVASNNTSLSTGPRSSVVDGREVLNASPSNPAPLAVNNAGISDENDFGAVSGRQSIESDKARIEANRAQYAVVQPTALPSRNGASQPNVVEYALQTSHPRGTQVHRRLRLGSNKKTTRNCAAYSSVDEAQIDFLARGGPVKDRLALDPDGDGYACGWDPSKYRG